MARPSENEAAVWMWVRACELIDHADRLHRQFFRPAVSAQAFAVWEPPIDMFEDARELVIVVAMPGVTPEGVEVLHEPGQVTVRGSRSQPLRGTGHRVRRLEIPYGGFERRIALPPGRFEPATTVLSEGCLVVRLDKLDREPR